MRFEGAYSWSLDGELDEMEVVFKSIYEKNASLHFEQPHKLEYYTSAKQSVFEFLPNPVRQMMMEESLEENSFFQEGQDIELYRHQRYLPCLWHSHDFLEVVCVIQGGCTHYIADQELKMHEGDICIVAPNTMHAVSVFYDDGIILNILIRISTFETVFFGTLTDNTVLSRFFNRVLYGSTIYPYLYFKAGHDQRLFNFIGYAYEEACGKGQYKKQMLNSIITGMFVMLLRNHEKKVIVPGLEPLDKDQNLFYILNYMQKHYDTVTLQEIAAFFNYSERKIQRLVISVTGINFSANILRLKMDQAGRLLMQSDMSVTAIAEKVGYTDSRNFRRLFKKYYGMTPTKYREKSGAKILCNT